MTSPAAGSVVLAGPAVKAVIAGPSLVVLLAQAWAGAIESRLGG